MPVHCIFTNLPEVIIAQVATTDQFSKKFYVKPKYILKILKLAGHYLLKVGWSRSFTVTKL